MMKLSLFLLILVGLGGPVHAESVTRSSSSYANDFVLESGRLEQGERHNAAESSSETADLFDQASAEQIDSYEQNRIDRQKADIEALFEEDPVKVKDRAADANTLFGGETDSQKVLYTTPKETEAAGWELDLLYYGLLVLLLLGGLGYISYIFLRGTP